MLREKPIEEVVRTTSELGYSWIELTPREDMLPYYSRPRLDADGTARVRRTLADAGIGLASLMVLYNWSDPDEQGRLAAVRYWKRAVEIAVDLGCEVINTEFSGDPEHPTECEASFWRSLEELMPIFEREGIRIDIEPHPGDFVETNAPAVDMVRGVDSKHLRYLYCAPHTFHLGDDAAEMVAYAAPVLSHVHIADSYNHKASSGFRYILNPADSTARVHQHNVIGVGDVGWEAFFAALATTDFDGILTSCVLGWEDQAMDRSVEMKAILDRHLAGSGLDARIQDFDQTEGNK